MISKRDGEDGPTQGPYAMKAEEARAIIARYALKPVDLPRSKTIYTLPKLMRAYVDGIIEIEEFESRVEDLLRAGVA